MNRLTSYAYQGHLLTRITNALGEDVERMAYDTYTAAGKVISQALQTGEQRQFQYLSASTVITTTGVDGRQDVQHFAYAPNNTLLGISTNGQAQVATAFDGSFSPSVVTDGNGYTTRTVYSSNRLPLRTIDALGNLTQTSYDAFNRPISITDTLGVGTQYQYDTRGNVTRTTAGITTTSPLRATTLYTYTYDVPYAGNSRLSDQRSPDGVVTHYAYNSSNQVSQTTVGYGTALAQTTAYGYDSLGRVVTTTLGFGTSLAQLNVTNYNADNTVAQTIQNYQDGGFTAAHPDEDISTTYGYDALGRQIWVRDALGHYDVTHYNPAGQVDWTARNFSASGWNGGTSQPSSLPNYTPSAPDINVATHYGYDGLGRTVLVTQTGILTGTFNTSTLQFSSATTRVTKTEYDALSRPITVTLNYRPDVAVGALPDVNIQTLTYYDGAGNVIWQRDALGRWTKTEYDALNRPVKTIVNYQDGDPLTGARDADIVSVTQYDTAGRVDRTIENWVNGAFTATEPITDRVTLYQYDTLSRVVTTTLGYDPPTLSSRTDTNRSSVTAYDPSTTRFLGQRDALGRWVSQQYDALGRITTSIQNCRTSADVAVAQGCAAFSSATPDRNVPTSMQYDALGRTFETVDALNHVAHTSYDGLSRTVGAIQNYVAPGSATSPITNVTTLTSYDALGRTTVMTDAVGAATRYSYNGLGQRTQVTDPRNRITTLGYDGTGAQRFLKRPDGQLTVYQLDGLGRVVTTIVNYVNGVRDTTDTSDQDLIARTVYDLAGRQVQQIQRSDPADRVTAFAYDNLDRLIGVTENVVSGTCPTAPCNVVTQYQYDRAGNRMAIVDALSHVRTFGYNAANEPTTASDALNRTTNWEYDRGGRVTLQHDPRGSANDLSYSYDGLDRQTQITASNLGTISAQYNALGWRMSLTDGTGTTSFSYDPLGRISQVTAPNTGSIGYGYDARGARTQLTYPGGLALSYGYWADGQLQAVTNTLTLASYSYDTAGRLAQLTRANGATTVYTYDGADRLRDLRTTVGVLDVSRFQYTVDRLGQRTQATETRATPPLLLPSTRVISYTYDGLLRLTGATESPGASSSYSYDLAGNRTDGGRSYDAANQVIGWTYDAAGNLTNDGTATYSYDALSRMTARGTTSYSYNGDGVLVFDGTTRYTQDLAAPLSQVVQTTQGSTTTNHLYGLNRLASVSGSVKTWYGADALGSVRQTLSDVGTPLSVVNYDPWGTVESGSVPTFGFTGELQDATAGLVNLRARWYATGQGRFVSRDPFAGFAERPYSLHQYQYAYSDPVLNRDPSGRCMPLLAVVDGPLPFGDAVALVSCLIALGAIATQNQADAVTYYNTRSYQGGAIPLYPGPPATSSATASVFPSVPAPGPAIPTPGAMPAPPEATPTPVPAPAGGAVAAPTPIPSSQLVPGTVAETDCDAPATTQTQRRKNPNLVYRNPGPGQHPGALVTGFLPKAPGNYKRGLEFHVRRGSDYDTRFISVTRSLAVALNPRWKKPGIPVYIINLAEVVGIIYDLTIPAVREAHLKSPQARDYAKASQEVVIEGWIPPTAIKGTIP